MKARWLLAAAVALVGADAAKDSPKEESKELQGTWRTVSLTYNGKEMPRYGGGKLKFVIKGEVITVEADAAVKKEYAKLKFVPDPSTTPKCLDLTVVGGSQKDAVLEGIYELKGDELKLCAKVFGKDRPTKFESPEGESVALLVLKREKK
jgi:uncharacterized protein (TIGR03067 family)